MNRHPMLAQSLFTSVASPIADQAAGGRASGAERQAGFEALLDQERASTEGAAGLGPGVPLRPEVLPAVPDEGQATKAGDAGPQVRPDVPDEGVVPKALDWTGPQIRPDVPDEGPEPKVIDWTGPQIRPRVPDEGPGAKPRDGEGPQVRPDVSDSAKPASLVDGFGPQILPATPDPGPGTAKATDGRQILPDPRALPAPRATGSIERTGPTDPAASPEPDPLSPATADGAAEPVLAATPAAGSGSPSAAVMVAAAAANWTPPARSINGAQEPASRLREARATLDGRASEVPAPSAEPGPNPTATRAPTVDLPATGPGSPQEQPAPSHVLSEDLAPPARPPEASGADRAAEPVAPSVTSAATPSDARGFAMSRVGAETLADLSAQIVRRLEGRSTRFEMALTPEHLGRVDVSLEIGEDGGLTAHLVFDTPAAAAELRSRVDELRRQLEQAGFQLGRDALEFSQRDPSSGRQDGWERRSGRAFAAARDLAGQVEAEPLIRLSLFATPDRVDLKV
jgi:flagellar hook-length control protein FliK